MIRLLSIALAFGLLAAASPVAAQVTYNFQGSPYGVINNSAACTVGECSTFTGAHAVTAALTFAGPLPPNLVLTDVSAQVTAYSFSDGLTTTHGPGANAALFNVQVTTDAAGVLTNYNIILERTPGPPYLVAEPDEANSRVSLVTLEPGGSEALANYECTARGGVPAGVSGPGACNAGAPDLHTSQASTNGPTAFTVTTISTVPTLSEWAMILMGLVLAGAAILVLRRRAETV